MSDAYEMRIGDLEDDLEVQDKELRKVRVILKDLLTQPTDYRTRMTAINYLKNVPPIDMLGAGG